MRCLITGGLGQLGLALSNELSSRDIDFVATNSSELDITNQGMVDKYLDLIKPDVIFNAAAWTDVDGAESDKTEAYSVNALGPQNLAMAAKHIDACLVHVSTDYVFSGIGTTPWGEAAIPEPQSVYGWSKSAGEKFALEAHPHKSHIVRTAWLYSAQRKNFAKTMTKLALNNSGEVRVVDDQTGQPTFTGDLAKQLVNLITNQAPCGIYHGTNSGQATWFEYAQKIFELAGANVSRVVPVSSSEFSRPAKRPAYSVLGHEGWVHPSIPPMRDWKAALTEAMPAIIYAVKAEG